MILSLQLNREALDLTIEPHYMQDYNPDGPAPLSVLLEWLYDKENRYQH